MCTMKFFLAATLLIIGFTRCLNAQPDSSQMTAVVLNEQGAKEFQSGQTSKALESFKRAIAIRPLFPEALNNLGATYNAIGKYDEALDAFARALKVKPDYAEAYY